MMQILTIELEPGQPMKVAVDGMSGSGCTELTRFLEQIGQLEGQTLTQEYYQAEDILLTPTQAVEL
ncbi:hypothetical protein BST81_26560 [Leptolyngbya sp. 'hensonii']|uniref:DUF2997 domain-containing protein n=1 Tax=Leptolyngbya sp. 'hensonii' TaxID=1922337 RepID=UPI00094F69BE|nr:DUF2997 domain-containing protein [Leptolyngbya sp. 'hensonii']OLP15403.1 hypothetical protein BST81_26560 [Leptolyngbya sp. 'hensonii']